MATATHRPPAPRPPAPTRPDRGALLAVRGVGHRYGATVALDDVDLDVAAGECVALLGPNGAGKTTLVNAVIGLVSPQQGTVRIGGGDPHRAATRRAIGVVQQSVGFPSTLKVGEIVRGAAIRAGVPASAAGPALAEVGLADLAGRRASKLSGGQQQRLQLAAALASDPALLVLDEPTEGLDAGARRRFWDMIATRRDRGTGVILTTHIIDEASAVADRVVVLQHGRVIAEDHPTALTARLRARTVTIRTDLDVAAVAALDGALEVAVDGVHLRVRSEAPEAFLAALHAADPGYHDLRVVGASLEAAIVALTADDDPSSAPTTDPEVAA